MALYFFGVGAMAGFVVSFFLTPKLFRDASEKMRNPPDEASRWYTTGIVARFAFNHRLLIIVWALVGGLAGLLAWAVWELGSMVVS